MERDDMNNQNQTLAYGDVDFDTERSNTTNNPHFADVLQKNLERRGFIKGTLGAAVGLALAGKGLDAEAKTPIGAEIEQNFLESIKNLGNLPVRPGFQPVPVSRPVFPNGVLVPQGYSVDVILKWGEPITGSYPAYKPDGTNTGAEQEQQIGQHHDGMHYFGIGGFEFRNRRGLLCINHEYIEQAYLLPNGANLTTRVADDVRKEIAAHGVSVVEIERVENRWQVVRGMFNRRITAGTPMEITGPARGNAKLRTLFSPDGTMTRGTINNCAHGWTPWGTYLTCEENWAGYYVNRDATRPREHTRYGVATTNSRYRWDQVEPRFDASTKTAAATGDFRNEPNGQGWVVEIDPYNPNSIPKKRTALGRFAHEGVWFAPFRAGDPVVCYSGDDSQNEYIYKFVSERRWVPLLTDPNILETGTLFVARFNDNGTGDWLRLDVNDPEFRARAAAANVVFADQGDLLLNTRLAADVVGATRMDRPEWGAVDPRTGQVYMTLTNNSSRTAAQVNPMNPRGPNPFGHIIRWREQNDDAKSTRFEWNLLLLAGTETDSRNFAAGPNATLNAGSIHASPDGLWFDRAGLLWIQTDMAGSQQASGPFGENAMLAMDVRTGDIRRFSVGPSGQETTGVDTTPDMRTMFMNLQHPQEGRPNDVPWPDGPGTRPRSATVVITKNDGGIIGS
jgi:secreted PhoX family phosphatase